MAFGLGVLRLSPHDFWSMTPRELVAALGSQPRRGGAPNRETIERLMARFPDT